MVGVEGARSVHDRFEFEGTQMNAPCPFCGGTVEPTPAWIDASALQAAREIIALSESWTYTRKIAAIQVIVAREIMRAAPSPSFDTPAATPPTTSGFRDRLDQILGKWWFWGDEWMSAFTRGELLDELCTLETARSFDTPAARAPTDINTIIDALPPDRQEKIADRTRQLFDTTAEALIQQWRANAKRFRAAQEDCDIADEEWFANKTEADRLDKCACELAAILAVTRPDGNGGG